MSVKHFWKLAAIVLLFLVVCPITAPFSSYDFEAATNIHDSITASKTAQDVPLPIQRLPLVSAILHFIGARAAVLTAVAESDQSGPLVLRL